MENFTKLDDIKRSSKLTIELAKFKNKLNNLPKLDTNEKNMQTECLKFDNEKLNITNEIFNISPIQVKNINSSIINDQESLSKQDTNILHQMLRQKAVFEIEKLV